jgi:hypothetical protein
MEKYTRVHSNHLGVYFLSHSHTIGAAPPMRLHVCVGSGGDNVYPTGGAAMSRALTDSLTAHNLEPEKHLPLLAGTRSFITHSCQTNSGAQVPVGSTRALASTEPLPALRHRRHGDHVGVGGDVQHGWVVDIGARGEGQYRYKILLSI